MALKRPSEIPLASSEKQLRESLKSAASHLLCPVCHELPLNPVFAEDGMIYDRDCINKWLKKKQTSPMTNAQMGKTFRAAPQVKAALEQIIRSGALDQGNVGSRWRRHIKHADKFRDAQQAAEQGCPDASFDLGNYYRYGRGIEEDLAKAFEWYSNGAAKGSIGAMFALAWSYAEGAGVLQNDAMAMYWLREAADKHDPNAMVVLGHAFKCGQYGVLPDPNMAYMWFERAAENHQIGKLFLGYCYKFGIGVEKDAKKATNWFTQAAASEIPSSRAQKMLTGESEEIDWPQDIFSDDEDESDSSENEWRNTKVFKSVQLFSWRIDELCELLMLDE